MKLTLFITTITTMVVTTSAAIRGGRRLEDEDAEDKKIGGVIGESNPPADYLTSPFLDSIEWTDADQQEADEIVGQIDTWMNNETSRIGALLTGSIAAVCNQNLVPQIWTYSYLGETQDRCEFWTPYLRGEKTLSSFFNEWLYYTPIPGPNSDGTGFTRDRFIRPINGPGYYIELYDFIANTIPGREVNFRNDEFAAWMVKFLNIHGLWLQTPASVAPFKVDNPQDVTPAELWIDYTAAGQHPYDIDEYIVPKPTFPDYTQIFLRNLKAGTRPLEDPGNLCAISSPCDGGIGMLSYGHVLGTTDPWGSNSAFDGSSQTDSSVEGISASDAAAQTFSAYEIPGKLGDTFGIVESFPGYGHIFLGGPVIDILLWFTDYHHFHSPVTGTVVYANDFMGSHQYDFDNFDPFFPFGPKPSSGSNQVEWYSGMDKHRRFSLVIDAGPGIGMVGMAPVGFWGVGSMKVYIKKGDKIGRGDYIGHFLYGGSSILLVFEPNKNFNWVSESGVMIGNIEWPHQANVKSVIGHVDPGATGLNTPCPAFD